MKPKKSIWTVLLLITIIIGIMGNVGAYGNWHYMLGNYEDAKSVLMFIDLCIFIMIAIQGIALVFGFKNQREFVYVFSGYCILNAIVSLVLVTYLRNVFGVTGFNYSMTYKTITFSIIGLLYITTSNNIKAVYLSKFPLNKDLG